MLAFLNRAPLRLHPIDTVRSLRRGQTCLPPVPEFSELEGANLIDFHLLLFFFFFSLACISQSPDGARLFCSLSVLTGSQLALDMSMSSLLESCWILGVSVYFSLIEPTCSAVKQIILGLFSMFHKYAGVAWKFGADLPSII